MKKQIHFDIWGPGWQHVPHIDDPKQHKELIELAAQLQLAKGGAVRCSPDHPGLPILLAELRKLGWTAHREYVPLGGQDGRFQLRTIVSYDASDIDASELLYLDDRWAEWCICGRAGRRDRRWIGKASRVGKHSGLGWDQTHGEVDGVHNYFVHPKVRAHFEAAGLQLIYHLLEWDKPEEAEGEFWEIDTPHTMPPCLNHIAQDESGMRFYDDEGREPTELKFRREEVATMGDIDAAWTREDIGKPGDLRDGGHLLVVSQRFRRACLDFPLEHVSFVPVRLVD